MTRTPRCTEPGCPVRYRGGPDRACAMHRADDTDLAARAAEYSAVMAAPGERSDGTDGSHAQ